MTTLSSGLCLRGWEENQHMFFFISDPFFLYFWLIKKECFTWQCCTIHLIGLHRRPKAFSPSQISTLIQSCEGKRDKSGTVAGNFFCGGNIRSIHKEGWASGARQSSLERLPALITIMPRPHSHKMFQNSWNTWDELGRVCGAFDGERLTQLPLLKQLHLSVSPDLRKCEMMCTHYIQKIQAFFWESTSQITLNSLVNTILVSSVI